LAVVAVAGFLAVFACPFTKAAKPNIRQAGKSIFFMIVVFCIKKSEEVEKLIGLKNYWFRWKCQ
jgi:hypothetical protein